VFVNGVLTAGAGYQFQGSGRDAAIALSNSAPIPEPSTWALMGLGLAALGLLARRRSIRGVPARA
jgi:hypothetical protein